MKALFGKRNIITTNHVIKCSISFLATNQPPHGFPCATPLKNPRIAPGFKLFASYLQMSWQQHFRAALNTNLRAHCS